VLGIHEGVIGVEAEQRFASAQFRHRSYDEIFVRRQVSWQDAVSESALGLADGVRRIGIEVDLDVIADMPSSATSPSGVSVEDTLSFVHYMASRCQCVYAHFAEGDD
jgi:formiminoglutamase